MTRTLLVVLLLSSVTIAAVRNQWGVEENEEVAVLKDSTFDTFLNLHNLTFVKFYAPWCDHCKSMAPEWTNLSKRIKKEKLPFAIAEVDATENQMLQGKYDIKSFPIMKLFVNSEPIDYLGPRMANVMYDWALSVANRTNVPEVRLDELDELERKRIAVIYVFPQEDKDAMKHLQTLAAKHDKVPFYYSHDDSIREAYQANEDYVYIILRNFDGGKRLMLNRRPFQIEELKFFFENHAFPKVEIFDDVTAQRLFSGEKVSILLFRQKNDTDIEKAFRDAAGKLGKQYMFAIVDMGGANTRICDFIGVSPRDAGEMRIIQVDKEGLKKFKCEAKTAQEIEDCIEKHGRKKLKQWFKSQVHLNDEKDAVKSIVGNTFEERVMDPEKNVLLLVSSPWCRECSEITEDMKKISKELNKKDLMFAKYDGHLNETPLFESREYPSLWLFAKFKKNQPVQMKDKINKQNILSFLKENLNGISSEDL